jgi:hypothetical protein
MKPISVEGIRLSDENLSQCWAIRSFSVQTKRIQQVWEIKKDIYFCISIKRYICTYALIELKKCNYAYSYTYKQTHTCTYTYVTMDVYTNMPVYDDAKYGIQAVSGVNDCGCKNVG